MVRISDIVGTLLRGITMARIQSDVFSSQASLQYLQNESLKAYPVPRAEIRQADFNMKMAVLETAPYPIDEQSVAQQTLTEALPTYVDKLLAIKVKPSAAAPDSQLQPLSGYLGENAAAIKDQLRDQLEAYLVQNIATLYPKIMDAPAKFGSAEWRDRTITVLQAVMTARQIQVYLAGTTFTKAVQVEAVAWANSMQAAVNISVHMAKTAFFDLDLAVKKDQILMLPEHIMSELRLSVVIENYEWTTIKDKQGNTIHKLTHK
jgi:hypothetical protein